MQKKITIIAALALLGLVCSIRLGTLPGGKEAGKALFEPLNAIAFVGMFVGWASAVAYGVYVAITHFLKDAPEIEVAASQDTKSPEPPTNKPEEEKARPAQG